MSGCVIVVVKQFMVVVLLPWIFVSGLVAKYQPQLKLKVITSSKRK